MNKEPEVKSYVSHAECERLRKQASEHHEVNQPRRAERLAQPYQEPEQGTVQRISAPKPAGERTCDFCNTAHNPVFLTNYGTAHYNRLMCTACEQRINAYHRDLEASK